MTKQQKIDRARELWLAGKSLYEIATTLGVTKEWLRENAGIG